MYSGQDNYWPQQPQEQYSFETPGFGQPNQQFEFQSYTDEQVGDYNSYGQKSYLDPTQNAHTGDMMYPTDDFGKGSYHSNHRFKDNTKALGYSVYLLRL